MVYFAILKLRNILNSFDDFAGEEILSDRDFQDYHSRYIELYNHFRSQSGGDRENVIDDIEFEMELIKQVEINIDYILVLVRKYYENNSKNKEIIVNIQKTIDSSIDLRNKKELILNFVDSLTPSSNVDEDWEHYVKEQKESELNKIIEEEKLIEEETKTFIDNSFKNGEIQASGTSFANILPPISRFSKSGDLANKKESVLEKLRIYFDRYFNI